MSVLESTHLRDLLRVRDNEDDGRDSLAGLTLAAVLGCETSSSTNNHIRRAPSRTLLDIIKDEESGAAYRGLIVPPLQSNDDDNGNKKSWKSFRNRLRLCRAGAAFSSSTSSHPVSACDFSIQDCNIRISPPVLVEHRPRTPTFVNGRSSNSSSVSPQNEVTVPESVLRSTANSISLAESLAREREEQRPTREEVGSNLIENVAEQMPVREEVELNLTERPVEETPAREEMRAEEVGANTNENPVVEVRNEAVAAEVTVEEVVAPPRVSLMALLEETDWGTGGIVGTTEMEIDDEMEEEKKDNKVEGKEGGGGEYVCCVCMVRHKGAAFIPCGHTFCRLCSRELWVNRGNCPLCNGFILEILDIF